MDREIKTFAEFESKTLLVCRFFQNFKKTPKVKNIKSSQYLLAAKDTRALERLTTITYEGTESVKKGNWPL